MNPECFSCKKTEVDLKLHKCPICFKHFCEEHSHQRSGLWFCSKGCSEYFFFADPDD